MCVLHTYALYTPICSAEVLDLGRGFRHTRLSKVGIVGQGGIKAIDSPVSLVVIPGVVGLVALEGLLGV